MPPPDALALPAWELENAPILAVAFAADSHPGVTAAWRLADGRLAVALSDEAEYAVYDTAGRRMGQAPLDNSAAAVSVWWKGHTVVHGAGAAAERNAVRRQLAGILGADTLAPHNVRVAPRGLLWVQRWQERGDASVWIVFDSLAQANGRVTVPHALALTEVGADHVVGVWHDAAGAESVRVHALRPGPPVAVPAHIALLRAFTPPEWNRFPQTRRHALTGELRAIYSRQQVYHRTAGVGYARRAADLPDFTQPEHAVVRIQHSGPEGWVAAVLDTRSGGVCMVTEGTVYPPDAPPGRLICF